MTVASFPANSSPSGFYNLDRAESAIDHGYSTQEYESAKNGSYSSSSITTQLDKLREIVGWIDEAGRKCYAS